MHKYSGNSAKGKARAHYGDFHGNTTYNNGDVHGNTIYNLTLNQRPARPEDDPDKALILSSTKVRPIDARFSGDERAIATWLKTNNLTISKSLHAEESHSLIDRISKYSVHRTYHRLASRKLSGTTQWILGRPELKEWLESARSTELFLVGKVGSGKTTLMTTVIEHALKVSYPKSPVLSFFFEDPASAAIDLFTSLTQQLLRHMIAARKSVSEIVRLAIQQLYNEEITKPLLREIQTELFEPLLQYFPGCLIVVDGIEGASVSPVALYFRQLRDRALFKILMSTRDDFDLPVKAPKIVLAGDGHGTSHNDQDIRSYIDMKLKGQALPGSLLEDESLRNLVREELLRNAKGMFLWVVMQIEYLFGRDQHDGGICQTAQDVHNYIMEMPPSLNGIYENCLRRQPGPQRRFTARVLRWVCASPEPVHIDNMRELLAVDLITRTPTGNAIPLKGSVVRAATNLLVLESSDHATGPRATSRDYLLPIHSTVRDFLFSTAGQKVLSEVTEDAGYWTQPDTVLELGGICAAYLLGLSGREVASRDLVVPSSAVLNKVYDTSLSPGIGRATRHTVGWLFGAPKVFGTNVRKLVPTVVEERLLEFARRNWLLCLRHAKKNSQEYRDFKALVFEHAEVTQVPWAQQHKDSTEQSRLESLFFWALCNDHVSLLQLAIEENVRRKLLPARFWTEPLAECAGVPLLHFAVKRLSEALITLLLPLCSGTSSYGRGTALHCAAESASLDVVSLLLCYVDGTGHPYRKLLAQDTNGRIPLHLAAIRNRVDVCKRLCDNFFREHYWDFEKSCLSSRMLDRDMRSPLYYALLTGSHEMVEIIMDAHFILYEEVKSGGTLDSVRDVASQDSVAYVAERLISDHFNWLSGPQLVMIYHLRHPT